MRQFTDLHLRPQSQEAAKQMADLARALGFKQVAFTTPGLKAGEDGGLKTVTRIDLDAAKKGDLVDALRRSRRRYDIVAVRCLSKEVARHAARDHRVDILLFPEDPSMRRLNWLDVHEAELAEGTGCAYEVNASEMLGAGPARLAKVISQIKRDLFNAVRHDIPVVLSSGASSPLTMREPRALAALAGLLDVDESYATEMITTNPSALIERSMSHREDEG